MSWVVLMPKLDTLQTNTTTQPLQPGKKIITGRSITPWTTLTVASNAIMEEEMEEDLESIVLPGTFLRVYAAIILALTSMVIHPISSKNAWISLSIALKDWSKISTNNSHALWTNVQINILELKLYIWIMLRIKFGRWIILKQLPSAKWYSMLVQILSTVYWMDNYKSSLLRSPVHWWKPLLGLIKFPNLLEVKLMELWRTVLFLLQSSEVKLLHQLIGLYMFNIHSGHMLLK